MKATTRNRETPEVRRRLLIEATMRSIAKYGYAGTTIETTIRIMSRWNKDDVVRTEHEGFVIVDRGALDALASRS